MRKRRAGKTVLAAAGVLLLAVAGYVIYVFTAYYRLEDNLPLMVTTGEGASPAVSAGETYRLASYNIGFGAYSDDFTFFMDGGKESRARSAQAAEENVAGALAALTALEPDVVLLQEVDVDGTRSHHVDELSMVLEAMGGYDATFAQNYDSPYLFWPLLSPHGANRAGLVTLSRFSFASALRRSLPIEESLMKLVDLDRCYSVQRMAVENGRELVLYHFHLSAYTSDGTIAEEQLEMLLSDMLSEYEAGNYVVGGGDFNKDILGNSSEVFGVSGEDYTWAQPIPAELIPEGLSIIAPLDEENPVPSCRNADMPYGPENFVVMVDGFIVSDNVTVVSRSVVDTGFHWSDHNPVYVDIQLQEP